MRRKVALMVGLALAAAACGPQPLDRSPPIPSAVHAHALAYKACRSSVQTLGLRRFARKVGAPTLRLTTVAHAAVRYALPYVKREAPGYLAYRPAGYRGCLSGLRSVLRR